MSVDHLREIPSVSAILEDIRLVPLLTGRRQIWMTRLIQDILANMRQELKNASGTVKKRPELLEIVVARVIARQQQLIGPSWTRVINGTGVVVHTNLGRAKYPALAADWAHEVAISNSDLEFNLAEGTRGHRGRAVEEKMALLAGSQDALIVNNNAAAVWLAVRHLSNGGRVILSRGEVVAIGGSFRINEILAETGCQLVEVGTTNRTSVDDYRTAIEPGSVVLKVHRSNYVVTGFTEEVELADLAQICREEGCPLIYDAGSGALFPHQELGLPAGESLLTEDITAGPDLITCSGDKLLGGPQAGFILGSKELVTGLRNHPMRRAFRVDKTALAAVDGVLSLYLRAEQRPAVPVLDQLAMPLELLAEKAEKLLKKLAPLAPVGWTGKVVAGNSSVGGGTFSSASIESRLLLWEGPKGVLEFCYQKLRRQNPGVVGRMNQEGLAVDVRTITDEEMPLVVEAFTAVFRSLESGADRNKRSES